MENFEVAGVIGAVVLLMILIALVTGIQRILNVLYRIEAKLPKD